MTGEGLAPTDENLILQFSDVVYQSRPVKILLERFDRARPVSCERIKPLGSMNQAVFLGVVKSPDIDIF